MRIAQVAPLFENVPPTRYGGTERIVSYLTEELVAQGHEVTLFAIAGSATRGRLVVVPLPRPLRLEDSWPEISDAHNLVLQMVIDDWGGFDVVHLHINILEYPRSRQLDVPNVTTFHGRLDGPDLRRLSRQYLDMAVVSVSDDQRRPLPWLNWQGTVLHGLPRDCLAFQDKPGSYLAFLGRTSPGKGLERAIEIAGRSGMELKIAAKTRGDQEYFADVIKPLVNKNRAEFVGEIGQDEKGDFLRGAYALLFPIEWPEPFGLVMIEAMACGTPVVAYPRGSVPEVIQDGVTGFIVENLDEAVKAVGRVSSLSRRRCREVFEQRFTASRMVRDYVAIYENLVSKPAVIPEHAA